MFNKILVICGIYFPHELLFKKFLNSCLNQTLDKVHFVFVLDHPKDINSRNILKEYQYLFNNSINQFTIEENEENIGDLKTYIKTFNKYQDDAEFVCFLDNDDFFDSDWLEVLYKYIGKKNLVCGNKIIHYLYKDLAYDILEREDTLNTWSILYRSSFLKKTLMNFKEEDIYKGTFEDLAKKFEKVCKGVAEVPLDEASFYHYIRHSGCMSACSLSKDQKINDHYNKYMDQDFYKTSYELTKERLSKKIQIEDEISADELEQYSILDKHLNNHYEDVLNSYL